MEIKIKELTIGQWHQICSKQKWCDSCPLHYKSSVLISCKPYSNQFDEEEIEIDERC